ncbi:hypothetical protein [Sphingomonas humi]|uniref:hypothetical protein n=1 Tax=Sphingomonas humi TaxID=335630 RepID=UPI0031D5E81F
MDKASPTQLTWRSPRLRKLQLTISELCGLFPDADRDLLDRVAVDTVGPARRRAAR